MSTHEASDHNCASFSLPSTAIPFPFPECPTIAQMSGWIITIVSVRDNAPHPRITGVAEPSNVGRCRERNRCKEGASCNAQLLVMSC